jgi:hypothetical protein
VRGQAQLDTGSATLSPPAHGRPLANWPFCRMPIYTMSPRRRPAPKKEGRRREEGNNAHRRRKPPSAAPAPCEVAILPTAFADLRDAASPHARSQGAARGRTSPAASRRGLAIWRFRLELSQNHTIPTAKITISPRASAERGQTRFAVAREKYDFA